MFTAIGFVLGVGWAFACPYLFPSSAHGPWVATVATIAGMVGLIGGGAVIDRSRKRSSAGRVER